MDLKFDVNAVLSKEITLVTNRDLLSRGGYTLNYHADIKDNWNDHSQNLSKIIDAMGCASSKAQKLRGAITTSFKLKSSEDHLYILKDGDGNNGFGSVIGIIRVGNKRLFLSDLYGQQHECQPLCVLDFYVHESKQRNGYGLKLFDCMIQNEQISPNELAIDRPSPKFVNFLRKHYSLDNPIQQVNKFVVFQSFFNDLQAIGAVDGNRRRSAPVKRNKNVERLRPTSRNASSANNMLSRKRMTDQSIKNSLDQLSGVMPIKHLPAIKSNQLSSETPTSLLTRPSGSRSQRTNLTTGMSSYSRYSSQGESNESANSPIQRKQRTEKNIQNTHARAPCNGTRNFYKNNIQTHGRTQPERNITSLDNPFSNTRSETNDIDKQHEMDVNHTVGLIDQLNRQQSFGTNWNVFGVPNSSIQTSNPYSKIKNRR